jgi:hypothetical protein
VPTPLSELKPGATVTTGGAGGFSAVGALKADALAQANGMNELLNAGPRFLTCTDEARRMTCSPLSESQERAAILRGDPFFVRTVKSDVSAAIGANVPVFDSDELVCDPPAGDGTLTCSPAGMVTPTAPPGQTLFASYKAFHGTINADGSLSVQVETPQVPLDQAP